VPLPDKTVDLAISGYGAARAMPDHEHLSLLNVTASRNRSGAGFTSRGGTVHEYLQSCDGKSWS